MIRQMICAISANHGTHAIAFGTFALRIFSGSYPFLLSLTRILFWAAMIPTQASVPVNPDMHSSEPYRSDSAPVTSDTRPVISTSHMNAIVKNTAFLGAWFFDRWLRNFGARPSVESPYIARTVP